ncbi:helix-turn-helix domain-containing protein [Erwinia sp. S38]|uniref:helix-turn-helix domain-containing protein n=1 Tax=Erwinia sp. S38 TaxID=2769338 RepID=UPI00190BCFA5|nr:helix-turn-helix domain-containing protein [Erwinia sp. S38]MBK0003144.1 helix-turn-helix domain-containing protein [Erwinia sp. S38]
MNLVIEKAIAIAGSQSELAKRVGVGQSTISKWLKGAEISSRYISSISAAADGKITPAEILSSLEFSASANRNGTVV